MKKQQLAQRFVLAALVCAFLAISFTSCHRGSGCPGRITYEPALQEIEMTDENC